MSWINHLNFFFSRSQNCHTATDDVPVRVNNEDAEVDTITEKNSGKIRRWWANKKQNAFESISSSECQSIGGLCACTDSDSYFHLFISCTTKPDRWKQTGRAFPLDSRWVQSHSTASLTILFVWKKISLFTVGNSCHLHCLFRVVNVRIPRGFLCMKEYFSHHIYGNQIVHAPLD